MRRLLTLLTGLLLLGPAGAQAAPVTELSSSPGTVFSGDVRVSAINDAHFGFYSSSGAVDGFQCRLNGGGWASCTDPKSYLDLADGMYTFEVRAFQGEEYGTPAAFDWRIDTTAPVITPLSGPPALTTATTATVTFSVSDVSWLGGETRCSIDSAEFVDCVSPVDLAGLADGRHSVDVVAFDAPGNASNRTEWEWWVDTTAPDTFLDTAPKRFINRRTARVEFSAPEEASKTFECKLDAGAYAPCASPLELTGLADGRHTLLVRGRDAAGNLESTPATADWTVDTAKPAVTLKSAPQKSTDSDRARFTFSANEAVKFACRLDKGAFKKCRSPKAYRGLARGAHRFQVRGTDAAGNVSATRSHSWKVR